MKTTRAHGVRGSRLGLGNDNSAAVVATGSQRGGDVVGRSDCREKQRRGAETPQVDVRERFRKFWRQPFR